MLSLCRLRMLLEVACRLDVLLSADLALWQHVAIFLDVASLLPVAEHHSHVALADALVHQFGLLGMGKGVGIYGVVHAHYLQSVYGHGIFGVFSC